MELSTLLAGDVVGAVSIGESDLLPDLTKDFLHIDKAELTNVTLDIELTINSDFDLRAYNKKPPFKAAAAVKSRKIPLTRTQCDNANFRCGVGFTCGRNKYGDVDGRFANYNPMKNNGSIPAHSHCCSIATNPHTVISGETMHDSAWCKNETEAVEESGYETPPTRINACRTWKFDGDDCPTGSTCGVNEFGEDDGRLTTFNPRVGSGVCCDFTTKKVIAGVGWTLKRSPHRGNV